MSTWPLPTWLEPASDASALDTPLRLTALVLVLRPMGPWYLLPALLAIGGCGLLWPAVLRAPATWWVTTGLIAARLIADWPLPDNHIYLLGYWCLAAALALGATDALRDARRSSRALLALTFTFAFVWKALLSPDYLDGRFFRTTLLTDDRFAEVALLVGGISVGQLAENRRALEPLPEGAELLDPPPLTETPRLRSLAGAMTWGGLMLEAAIAIAMMLPARRGVEVARHALLILFCLLTYTFAPVAGFGWVLIILGLALTRPEQRSWRAAYVAAFFIVLIVTEIPSAGLLRGMLGLFLVAGP